MPRWPGTTSPTSPSPGCSTRSPAQRRAPRATAQPAGRLRRRRDAAGARGGRRPCGSARESGQGQVVDAAIVDGLAAMTAMHQSMLGSGLWSGPRGANLLDGGAPFYRCYRTADDRWLAVGAIEPVFYARFLGGLGLDAAEIGAAQLDPAAVAAAGRGVRRPHRDAAARGLGGRVRRPRRVRGAGAHRAGGAHRPAPVRQGRVCRRPRLPGSGPTGPRTPVFGHSDHCRPTRHSARNSYRRSRA